MTDQIKVVVHTSDGRLLKGTTQDFFPNRPSFHLLPADGTPRVEVWCRQLKALFIVKDLRGKGELRDYRGFLSAPVNSSLGKKISVLFRDGEMLFGYSLGFNPTREGFFLTPADTGGNNIRVFVVMSATTEVKVGKDAEGVARQYLAKCVG